MKLAFCLSFLMFMSCTTNTMQEELNYVGEVKYGLNQVDSIYSRKSFDTSKSRITKLNNGTSKIEIWSNNGKIEMFLYAQKSTGREYKYEFYTDSKIKSIKSFIPTQKERDIRIVDTIGDIRSGIQGFTLDNLIPDGEWMFYTPKGTLDKIEKYSLGKLVETN